MGHKYRTKLADGSISGGPMYYIESALNMKWAGILFAFLMMITAIGSGNMPQINNIALVMNTEFSVPKLFTVTVMISLHYKIVLTSTHTGIAPPTITSGLHLAQHKILEYFQSHYYSMK